MSDAVVILKVHKGANAGARASLDPGSHTIGSDELECDIILHDDGIEPRHAVLSVAEDGAMSLEVLQGAAIEIDGRLLGAGVHELANGGTVRMGHSLLALRRGSAPHPPQEGSPAVAAASRRFTKPTTWIAGLFCTVGACASLFAVVSGTASADGGEADMQRVNALLTRQGRSDLRVSREGPEAIVVSGTVPSKQARLQLEAALQRAALRQVKLDVSVAGAVRQFGQVAAQGNASPLHLGKGTLLLDPPPPSAGASAATQAESIELRVTAVHVEGVDVPFIEASTGEHYEVGASLPGGYTLMALSREGLVLARGDARIIYGIQ